MATRADHTMEDTVEYRLFPAVPSELSGSGSKKYMEQCLDTYLAHLGKYLVNYIWQNESFQMRVVPETGWCPHAASTRYCFTVIHVVWLYHKFVTLFV